MNSWLLWVWTCWQTLVLMYVFVFQLGSREAAPADEAETSPPGVWHADLQERTAGLLLNCKASGKAERKGPKKKISKFLLCLWDSGGDEGSWLETAASAAGNLTNDAFRWPALIWSFLALSDVRARLSADTVEDGGLHLRGFCLQRTTNSKRRDGKLCYRFTDMKWENAVW